MLAYHQFKHWYKSKKTFDGTSHELKIMSLMRQLKKTTLVVAVALVAAGFASAVYFVGGGMRHNASEKAFRDGTTLYSQFQYDAANKYFLQALSHNNEFQLARRMLGQSLLFSGQLDAALNEWKLLLSDKNYDPSLALHVQSLENVAPSRENHWVFSRELPQKRGFRYSLPTFVGDLPSHNIFFLSLGLLDTGSLLEVSVDEGFRKNIRRVAGKLHAPIGAAVGEHEIWITDFDTDTIHRLNIDLSTGLPYLQDAVALGGKGSQDGQFHGPAGVAFCDAAFWVADYGNNRIQKFSQDGQWVMSFSAVDAGLNLNHPFGIACTQQGGVLVSEPDEGRLVEFDQFGSFVRYRFDALLKKPRHIFHDPSNGYLLVADEAQGVFIFDLQNSEHQLIEGYEGADGTFVHFARPYAATLDSFGNLFIADYGANSVVQFVPESRLVSNLDVYIENVIATSFPVVHVIASVKNEQGKPLTTLSDQDFSIFENDAYTGNLSSDTLKRFANQANYSILLSRSRDMVDYLDSLEFVLDSLLKELREKDQVQLISYTNDYRVDSPETNSRLRILQAAREKASDDYTTPDASGFTRGLYFAISQQIPKFGQRAVVLITDGSLSEDDTGTFALDRVENYALFNHVQIYVVSYENPRVPSYRANRERLQSLALRTGGAYYTAFGKLTDLSRKMRLAQEQRYMLTYRSGGDASWKNQYMDLKLTVTFQGRRGGETGGYFIPE